MSSPAAFALTSRADMLRHFFSLFHVAVGATPCCMSAAFAQLPTPLDVLVTMRSQQTVSVLYCGDMPDTRSIVC